MKTGVFYDDGNRIDMENKMNLGNEEEVIISKDTTIISKEAFYDHREIKKVFIPDSVKEIREKAFSCCTNLREVRLPKGIKKIPNECFLSCMNLTHIEIPEGVTSIGEGAFLGCESLKEVRFPKSLLIIKKNAFLGCKNLEKVEFSSFSFQKLEEGAFYECVKLKEAEILDESENTLCRKEKLSKFSNLYLDFIYPMDKKDIHFNGKNTVTQTPDIGCSNPFQLSNEDIDLVFRISKRNKDFSFFFFTLGDEERIRELLNRMCVNKSRMNGKIQITLYQSDYDRAVLSLLKNKDERIRNFTESLICSEYYSKEDANDGIELVDILKMLRKGA